MSQTVEVKVESEHMKFAEDKDRAKQLRKEIIMPALAANKTVVIGFLQRHLVHTIVRSCSSGRATSEARGTSARQIRISLLRSADQEPC